MNDLPIKGQDYCIQRQESHRNRNRWKRFRGTYIGKAPPRNGKERSFWHRFKLPDGSFSDVTRKNIVCTWSEYEKTKEYREAAYAGAVAAWKRITAEEIRKLGHYATTALRSPAWYGKVPRIEIKISEPSIETTKIEITLDVAFECMEALGYPVPVLELPPHPDSFHGVDDTQRSTDD